MRIHSWLSPKCGVRPHPVLDFGVFAAEPIVKGEVVAICGGIVLRAEEVELFAEKHAEYLTKTFSIWEGFYLAPLAPNASYDDTERLNHSCDPNIGVIGQIVFAARRDIEAGEEVCFDYDTTETEPCGGFTCRCGSPCCRGLIDGSAWRLKEFQARNRGYLSSYIVDKIRSRSQGRSGA